MPRCTMKRILNTLIALSALPILAFSQTNEEKKADKYYQLYSFDKAIDKYKNISNLDVDGLRKLAQSYHNRGQFKEAQATYAQFIETPSANVNDYYNYILLLKVDGKYTEVKKWYEKIKEKAPNDLRAKNFFATQATFPATLQPNSEYRIGNLEMNSADQDFGPSFYKNKVTFTSTRKGFNPFRNKYNWNNKPFLDIYVADASKNHELYNIQYWNKKVNKKWHQGPICFAKKGTFAAFTRNNYSDPLPEDDVVRLQLFFSTLEKGQWSEPEPFYLNSSEYSVGHASLTEDGNTMYFVSDMPGGYGGSDIYVVSKLPGTNNWGKPVNLGNKINTEANELFPFYDEKSGILFFASNGLNGLGGLDVYLSYKTPTGFDTPQNIGSPINSTFDDFSFILSGSQKYGYFSSNRPEGKGDDDIYKFIFTGEYKGKEPPPSTAEKKRTVLPETPAFKGFTYRIYVLNKETRKPIRAEVKIADLSLITNAEGMASHTYTHAIDYKVVASAVGYKSVPLRVTVGTFRDGYVMTDTVLLAANLNQRIVLKNIYYDYDKANILPESSVELDKLVLFMNDNPKLQVELSSHTDSRGSDAYNLQLSEERAKSAVNYIVSKGVDAARITAKGYGETRLVNGCSNGVPCSEKQHRQNRRTEVFITGYGKAQDVEQEKGKQ